MSNWHDERRKRVGCSELAALFAPQLHAAGFGVQRGPWSLWCAKRGLLGEREDTGPMRLGRVLEPAVLELAVEQLGCPVVPWSSMQASGQVMFASGKPVLRLPPGVTAMETQHDGHATWLLVHESGLCGTPDAVAFPADHNPFVVDAKTVGLYAMRAWQEDGEEQLPAGYELQGRGYCMLTGLPRTVFAALRLPPKNPDELLQVFAVERLSTMETAIAATVRAFVESMERDEEPPMDPVWDGEAAHARHRRWAPGRVVNASEGLARTLAELEQARLAEKRARERGEALLVSALPEIGEAEVIQFNGRKAICRGTGSRRSIRIYGAHSS